MTTTKKTMNALTKENYEVLDAIINVKTVNGYNYINYYLLGDETIKHNAFYIDIYACYKRPSNDKINVYNNCICFAQEILKKLNIYYENKNNYGITSYNTCMFTFEVRFIYKNYAYKIVLTNKNTKVYIKEL